MMPDKEETKVEETNETETSDVKEDKASKKEKKKIDSLLEENEKLKADLNHWKNEYYRAYADIKNLRTSLEKDHKEAIKYRAEGFIESLLPILDSFHMALANEPTNPELKNYLMGFQYVYRNMVAALENEGVSEISPQVNEVFTAQTMNAVDSVEGEKANIVTKVYGKGYKLHDRLIRPAMVQVTVLKKEKSEEKKNEEKSDA